jgi:hypothetical protein
MPAAVTGKEGRPHGIDGGVGPVRHPVRAHAGRVGDRAGQAECPVSRRRPPRESWSRRRSPPAGPGRWQRYRRLRFPLAAAMPGERRGCCRCGSWAAPFGPVCGTAASLVKQAAADMSRTAFVRRMSSAWYTRDRCQSAISQQRPARAGSDPQPGQGAPLVRAEVRRPGAAHRRQVRRWPRPAADSLHGDAHRIRMCHPQLRRSWWMSSARA